ncbi:MAG: site-2 protease family protein [Candidatus Magasanikbacteria bacterium]|nr:site-2 protease family protein [Candidatus Magasanikbacteria bacterium]MCA9391054.1 site-2 protease family protein [Candidatus Magasanikbacteria bacterium]USN52582.1 MAG: site-2 protease family protein [Candidatus Nomurabacteria bacterium]
MSFLTIAFEQPLLFIVLLAGFLLALSFHEMSHAWVGSLLGDKTAEEQGRLTINPLSHIDPVGLLLLIVAGFGYAKPVPYNPYRLRDPKWGPVLIALAGPISNLLLGIIAIISYALLYTKLGPNNLLIVALWFLAKVNIVLALFNLVPLPPLDGSKVLMHALDRPQTRGAHTWLAQNGSYLLLIAIILSISGILPVFDWITVLSDVIFTAILSLF